MHSQSRTVAESRHLLRNDDISERKMKRTAIADGIYRGKDANGRIRFYERPEINGRRTWRALEAPTLELAKAELAARKTDAARAKSLGGPDPYSKTNTVAELAVVWVAAGCPGRKKRKPDAKRLEWTKKRLETVLEYFGSRWPNSIQRQDVSAYHDWRKPNILRGPGERMVELELVVLSNLLSHGERLDPNLRNNIRQRDGLRDSKTVKHARDRAPESTDEVHRIANAMFDFRKSEVFGWIVLLGSMTGNRISELLALRMDAKFGEPGFHNDDGLCLHRVKRGKNPFTELFPALRECLAAHHRWLMQRFPSSPWYFPSTRCKGQPVGAESLNHAMERVCGLLSLPKYTPHGLRAFRATARRAEGMSDNQIAHELGMRSGEKLIASTYGDAPPQWFTREKFSWLPTFTPAWKRWLPEPSNVIQVATDSSDASLTNTGE